MRVALVNYRFSPTAGGVERHVFDLSNGLVERGHEVHVYCHATDGTMRPELIVHRVPCTTFYSALRTWTFARNAGEAVRRDRERYDVVAGFGRTLEQDVYRCGGGCHMEYLRATEPAMRRPLGRALTLLNPRHRVALALEARLFREQRFRRLICISHEVARQVHAYYGIPHEEMRVIHNGVDTTAYSPALRTLHRDELRAELGVEREEYVVLFVGSGFERKGLVHAVRACARLPAGVSWRLLVVGNGRKAPYQALAERLRIRDRVRFLGARRDAHRFYGAADALVFPTLFEPFGTVALEAMAAGLPVVTTRAAGCSEAVEEGVDSFVVDEPGREEDIADRLLRLAEPALRDRMGRAARVKAQQFTIERNIEATLQVYEEVRAEKTPAAGRA